MLDFLTATRLKSEVNMPPKVLFALFLLIGIVFSGSCSLKQTTPTPQASMANPASVHCEQDGGKLDFRQDAAGGVAGFCIFSDGSECDEWAYFRDECKPGDSRVTAEPIATLGESTTAPSASPELDSYGWKIYRNEELGYSFHYPADASIIPNDEPLKSFSVIGPLVGGFHWPQFTISHPSDRADYRPPTDADLGQWLIDHNLSADKQMPDVQIAGTAAIHTRFERSPQSYAFDRYYFAKSGQLYMITIGHTGDKEDWELYNRFLESIQFAK